MHDSISHEVALELQTGHFLDLLLYQIVPFIYTFHIV